MKNQASAAPKSFGVGASFPHYRLVAPDRTVYECDGAVTPTAEYVLATYHDIRARHPRGRIEIWDIKDTSYIDDEYSETKHAEELISLRRLRAIVAGRKLREEAA